MSDLKFSPQFNGAIRVLLIEDMPNLRMQMRNDLLGLGITGIIDEAENIALGVKQLKTNKYDLIICDWNLPDGTGFDLLVKFKESPLSKNTPFVLCTTVDEVSSILKALSAGADEYIVKPWQVAEIKKKIEAVMIKKLSKKS